MHAIGAKLYSNKTLSPERSLFGKIPVITKGNTTNKPVVTCFVLENEWPGDNKHVHTQTQSKHSNPAARAPQG